MSLLLITPIFVVASYLLGAIPFGLLIGLSKGIDIRQHGSKNIGATNCGRVVGKGWGQLCLALDILKGFIPTLVYGVWFFPELASAAAYGWWLAVALAAVLGHLFPVYLGFKGGKGVATTIGVGLGLWPHFTVAMIVSVIAYLIVRYVFGFVSLGSLTLAVVFPIALGVYMFISGLALSTGWPLLAVALTLTVLIFVRHKDNIRRLLRGEELAVNAVQAAPEPPQSTSDN
jgi:glycerol-3-phosphate acyltransferase PlsY